MASRPDGGFNKNGMKNMKTTKRTISGRNKALRSAWCRRALMVPAICIVLSARGWAADKNGVSPQTISLPSGPGSIQGLGESFQPQLNSGSGSYAIPLKLPKGPGGFAPGLTLQYHTGNGNGILGIGWKLSGPTMVSRNIDDGLCGERADVVDAATGHSSTRCTSSML